VLLFVVLWSPLSYLCIWADFFTTERTDVHDRRPKALPQRMPITFDYSPISTHASIHLSQSPDSLLVVCCLKIVL
jgi:hypothetical protein